MKALILDDGRSIEAKGEERLIEALESPPLRGIAPPRQQTGFAEAVKINYGVKAPATNV
jgi:hypothetical protein